MRLHKEKVDCDIVLWLLPTKMCQSHLFTLIWHWVYEQILFSFCRLTRKKIVGLSLLTNFITQKREILISSYDVEPILSYEVFKLQNLPESNKSFICICHGLLKRNIWIQNKTRTFGRSFPTLFLCGNEIFLQRHNFVSLVTFTSSVSVHMHRLSHCFSSKMVLKTSLQCYSHRISKVLQNMTWMELGNKVSATNLTIRFEQFLNSLEFQIYSWFFPFFSYSVPQVGFFFFLFDKYLLSFTFCQKSYYYYST